MKMLTYNTLNFELIELEEIYMMKRVSMFEHTHSHYFFRKTLLR